MNKQELLRVTIAGLQKELDEIIKSEEIPRGTLGYASDCDPNNREAVHLRYFSHMDNGLYKCFYGGKPSGSTVGWKYFTPMDAAILGRLIPHDGSSEHKGRPDDLVWPMRKNGEMLEWAVLAKYLNWPTFSGYYLIKKGGE